jgi:hypothetical protein
MDFKVHLGSTTRNCKVNTGLLTIPAGRCVLCLINRHQEGNLLFKGKYGYKK